MFKKQELKDAREVKIITEYLRDSNFEFLFATLTAPNCQQSELKEEITKYNKALVKMLKDEKYNFIHGYIRKLEITYNNDSSSKSYGTFHPHFHLLIAIDKSYFGRKYLSKQVWLADWRKAMADSSITQIDIKKVSLGRKNNIDKSILELTKYITKDFEFYSDVDVFENFYKGSKGKQMFAFSGIFRDAKRKLKNKELEKYADSKKEIQWYYLFTQIYNQDKYIVKQENTIELVKLLLSEHSREELLEHIKDEE